MLMNVPLPIHEKLFFVSVLTGHMLSVSPHNKSTPCSVGDSRVLFSGRRSVGNEVGR